jgi:hypothetical protein
MKPKKLSTLGFTISEIFVNLLSLSVPLFVINVYDKVLPYSAFGTLTILSVAVLTFIAVELFFKICRDYYISSSQSNLSTSLVANYPAQFISALNRAENVRYLNAYNEKSDLIRNFSDNNFFHLKNLIEFLFSLIFMSVIFLFSFYIGVLILMIFIFSILVNGFAVYSDLKNLEKTSSKRRERSNLLDYLHHALWNGLDERIQINSVTRWSSAESENVLQEEKARLIANVTANISSTLLLVAIVVTTIIGIHQINDGLLTIGSLIGINILTARVLSPCRGLSQYFCRTFLKPLSKEKKSSIAPKQNFGRDAERGDKSDFEVSISGYDLPDVTGSIPNRISCRRGIIYCLSEERGDLINSTISSIQLGAAHNGLIHLNGIGINTLSFGNRQEILSIVSPYSLLDSFIWADYEQAIDFKNPIFSQCYKILNLEHFFSNVGIQKNESIFISDVIPEFRRDIAFRFELIVSLINPKPIMFFDLSSLDISSRSLGLLFDCIKKLCPDSTLLVRSNRPDVYSLSDVGIIFENRKIIGLKELEI